jgi:DeoR/GlpR family transcriptional regulator of sugar metabolism
LSVADISKNFSISEVTIRKDLGDLCCKGFIERTHGSVRLREDVGSRYSLQKQMALNAHLKEPIAVAAVDMVRDGDAVFLGPGSTCAMIMKKLIKKNNIIIITNAINFEPLLERKSNCRIVFLGGEYSFDNGAVMGIISLEMLNSLNITKFFLGASAVSARDGLTSSDNLNDTEFIRMMLERSKEVILVVDHTKFGKTAAIRLAPISKLTKIITNKEIDEQEKALLTEQGAELLLV